MALNGPWAALAAIAAGAQGGFKAKDIMDKQAQDAADQQALNEDRKARLDALKLAATQAAATNRATYDTMNQGAQQDAAPVVQGMKFGSDAIKNLPFSGGTPSKGVSGTDTYSPAIPDLTAGPQADLMAQTGQQIESDVNTPKPFDPNIKYGEINSLQENARKLRDTEQSTMATRAQTKALADERLDETRRSHDAAVVKAADITAHAPAARAYLEKAGFDHTGLSDEEAVNEAQRFQHDTLLAKTKPSGAESGTWQLVVGADGKTYEHNTKSGEVRDAGVQKPSPAGKPDELEVLGTSIDKALAGRTSEPSGTGVKAILPNFILDRTNPAGAQQRFELGDVKSAAILLRDSKRASVQQMKQMEAMLPQPTDPDAVIQTKLTNLRALVNSLKGTTKNHAPPSMTGGAPSADPFADWKKGGTE